MTTGSSYFPLDNKSAETLYLLFRESSCLSSTFHIHGMQKVTILLSALFLLTIAAFGNTASSSTFSSLLKDPVVIDVPTKFTSVDDALMAAKNVLLVQKFIAANGIQKSTFTATRTTGSKADYYVADVTAILVGEKIKLSITFIKVGTGLLRLQKVADAVKAELEK